MYSFVRTLAIHFLRMIINIMWSLMGTIAINMQRKTIILRLYVCVCVCVCVCISLSVLLICYLPIHSVSNLETETVSVANCSNVLAKEWISGVL